MTLDRLHKTTSRINTLFINSIIFSLLFLVVPGWLSGGSEFYPELKKLYNDKQYFELRDALEGYRGDESTKILFYRGAVCNKFNQLDLSMTFLQNYLQKAKDSADTARMLDCYALLADDYNDTGANKSFLYASFFKAYQEEIEMNYPSYSEKVRGVGGFKELVGYRVKDLVMTFADADAHFAEIIVLTESTLEVSRYFYGNLGQDLVEQFEKMTLNFVSMSIIFE